jgi:hypothetical protein
VELNDSLVKRIGILLPASLYMAKLRPMTRTVICDSTALYSRDHGPGSPIFMMLELLWIETF